VFLSPVDMCIGDQIYRSIKLAALLDSDYVRLVNACNCTITRISLLGFDQIVHDKYIFDSIKSKVSISKF
jgi:hypothetical protein